MKKLGTYTYKRLAKFKAADTHPSMLEKQTLRVEIVDERRNQWRVKYLGFHASGAALGSLHWVLKSNVKLDKAEPSVVRDDIRSPYKD